MAAFALTASLLTACKGKSEAPADQKPEFTFTKQDTMQVMDLVGQFTTRLQNRDIKGAVEMLVFLNGDSIEQLNPAFMRRQAMTLVHMAGKSGYELDRIVFHSDVNNEVKVDITLFDKEEGDPRPNKTSFYFRPVRKDGKWYLTTKDNITDTQGDLKSAQPTATEDAAEVEEN